MGLLMWRSFGSFNSRMRSHRGRSGNERKGENLTDEMAYNNLSFLKETAPLPGRQISVGVDLKF